MKDKSQLPPESSADLWLSLLGRFLIGGIFIYSGFQKASAPAAEFAAVVEAYGILPPDWTLTFAQILPWIELIFGVFLVAGYWTRWSARVLAGLLGLFIGALLSVVLRKIPIESCGCYGASIHLSPRMAVLVDAFLLGCAVWLSGKRPGPWTADHWVESGRS
jgi:uncharacterized membrane protein YphA (DoxX/SURF4 family)